MTDNVAVENVRGSGQLTLGDQHALLLQQVASRAQEVLAACSAGQWPASAVQELVRYLRAELLVHAADEERLLFPGDLTTPGFDQLGLDHARLHELTEAIAAAAANRSAAAVAFLVRNLLDVLERHVEAEERLLGHAAPALADIERRGGSALTEGRVINLDLLPCDHAVDLVIDRLLRLRPGEDVELQSSRNLDLIWLRMNRINPGGYGFAYLQDGPQRWCVRVVHRAA